MRRSLMISIIWLGTILCGFAAYYVRQNFANVPPPPVLRFAPKKYSPPTAADAMNDSPRPANSKTSSITADSQQR